MRHYWAIYCDAPTAGPPALMAIPEDRDGLDALAFYYGGGASGLAAIAALPHEAREVQPHELNEPGFEFALTLECPHTSLPKAETK